MKEIYVYFEKDSTLAVTLCRNGNRNVKHFNSAPAALVWMNKQGVNWEWTRYNDGTETTYGIKK